jgi:hypothetical protein
MRGHNPRRIYQRRKSHSWLSQATGLLTLINFRSRVMKGI